MKAIILAAGLGSRLGILGKTIPKCLIKINGKFLLERQIDLLNNSGIDDITIVIGSYGECWTEKNKNIIKNIIKKVVINPENYKTNNTHSLKLALNKDNEE
ncbi:NTP transferase domain-containing protein, partial [Candidatus Pacearchaeota archaeon]|nr:NTP transferase domain-containing protein [Candidatus Pacearchaeota archaeon]